MPVFQVLVHADRKGIVGHCLGHTGAAGIATFRHDAFREVPFGNNSDQLAIMQFGDRTDVVLAHDWYGLQ